MGIGGIKFDYDALYLKDYSFDYKAFEADPEYY